MLRLKVLNLDAEARQCVICMDEMSLKANLYYDCSKSFSSISTRNRHIRDIHNDSLTSNSRITCPICSISHRSFTIFNDHLLKTHDIQCKSEEISFDTVADFEAWKEKMEKETKSFYALVKTAESTLGKTKYYACHRSNNNKFSGSIKINGVCPSRIKVEIHSATGKVSTTFTKTHAGHKEELKCQPLSINRKKLYH
nr:PREDICTED: uncharacterized protein LOC103312967 [Tribolium castaneum]|eukprot:XP_015840418.1 PREDICTED: uncharacterized protein LOC103312967 [Tribolium castaneum]